MSKMETNPYHAPDHTFVSRSDGKQEPNMPTSRLAIASLMLGMSSIIAFVFTGIPAIICGILSLRLIRKSSGKLRGVGFASFGIAFGILLPLVLLCFIMVSRIHGYPKYMTGMNNMRSITLGLHTYESNFGSLPEDICDENGTPILSWRVHLLPYLEDDNFYDDIRLDEPWDSEHNLPFSQRTPLIFRAYDHYSQITTTMNPGDTTFLAPSGKGMVFGSKRSWTLADIVAADGTDKTIALVRVKPSAAVNWLKPGDHQVDLKSPKLNLQIIEHSHSFFPDESYQLCTFDGGSHLLTRNIATEALAAMFTVDGKSVGQNYYLTKADFERPPTIFQQFFGN